MRINHAKAATFLDKQAELYDILANNGIKDRPTQLAILSAAAFSKRQLNDFVLNAPVSLLEQVGGPVKLAYLVAAIILHTLEANMTGYGVGDTLPTRAELGIGKPLMDSLEKIISDN